jgi:hypothetical protein
MGVNLKVINLKAGTSNGIAFTTLSSCTQLMNLINTNNLHTTENYLTRLELIMKKKYVVAYGK